ANVATDPPGRFMKVNSEPGGVQLWPTAGALAQSARPPTPGLMKVRSSLMFGSAANVTKPLSEIGTPTGSTVLSRFRSVPAVPPSGPKSPVPPEPTIMLVPGMRSGKLGAVEAAARSPRIEKCRMRGTADAAGGPATTNAANATISNSVLERTSTSHPGGYPAGLLGRWQFRGRGVS